MLFVRRSIEFFFFFLHCSLRRAVVEVLDENKELKMGHLKSRFNPRKKQSL